MTLNFVKAFFMFSGLFVTSIGLSINFFEKYLPPWFSKFLRHGKFCSNVKNKIIDRFEVPKRWFKHFYVFAGPFSTLGLALIYYRYCQNGKLPDTVKWTINFLMGQPTLSLIPIENTMFAMILVTIHCWKRYYETHYVNVYSNVYMNVSMYLVGLLHYFGTVISIIGESYDVTKDTKIDLNWTRLSFIDCMCAVVLLLSSFMQYRTNVILSNLRKNKKGVVVTMSYKIPQGELFNWISGPLQFTEIVVYTCLSIILRKASTFHFVTFWVIMNQVECAYLTHQWSLRTFENYPKRKIILPLVF